MPHLAPQPYQKLVRVFEKAGFRVRGQRDSHIKMNKEKMPRPLIIPMYPDVGKDIIKALIRTAKISMEEYYRLLGKS